jgi:hypothetical protein
MVLRRCGRAVRDEVLRDEKQVKRKNKKKKRKAGIAESRTERKRMHNHRSVVSHTPSARCWKGNVMSRKTDIDADI